MFSSKNLTFGLAIFTNRYLNRLYFNDLEHNYDTQVLKIMSVFLVKLLLFKLFIITLSTCQKRKHNVNKSIGRI